uniref:Uncharacterized protein n=1 Tax=Globisporangium ultimum (strain ATCC 200006 / CBS 805.95 / DAOM BR144) TaxID=431595 RepID=K3WYV3_GLOUD
MPKWSLFIASIWIYVIAQKVYRRRRAHSKRSYVTKAPEAATGTGTTVEKRTLTQFEIATGAELQNRFGVLADYANYVYFKSLSSMRRPMACT